MSIRNLIYRIKYNYGHKFNLTIPVDISLELSSHCQLRCEYCYHSNQDNLPFVKKHMSVNTAYRIITQAAAHGVNSIKFNWKGEGTLNPHYYNILRFAKMHAHGSTFIDRIINSNFQFGTDKREIFNAMCFATKVKISCDSMNKEVFEKQRTKGSFDLLLKNVDTFYSHPARESKIIIQAVRTNLNKNEDIYQAISKRWPGVDVSIRDVVEGRVENDISDLSHKTRDTSSRTPCKQAFVRLIFNAHGDAMMCCPDVKEEINLGSIHDTDLYHLFNSHQAKLIRRDLKSGVAFEFDPCKSCSSFESYKGYKGSWTS